MRNKKGFTLVELLAIIVILAVIMVIAVPKILDVVNGSKTSAWKNSVGMIKKAIVNNSQLLDPETGVQKHSISNLCANPSKLKEIVKLEDTTVTCSGNVFSLTGTGQFAGKSATITCTNNKCSVNINSDNTVLAAGLYDSNDNLLASWDELVNTYGMKMNWDNLDKSTSESVRYWPQDMIDENGLYEAGVTSPGWWAYNSETSSWEVADFDKIDPVRPSLVFQKYENLRRGTKLVIKEDLEAVPYAAFIECVNLETVVFPEGFKIIPESSFGRCINLKNIVISSTVYAIDQGAFWETGITNITVPGNVKYIGEGAFGRCYNLENVVFSEGVKEIDGRVLEDNTNLKTIVFPASLIRLGTIITDSKKGWEPMDLTNMNINITFNDPNNWQYGDEEDIDPINFTDQSLVKATLMSLHAHAIDGYWKKSFYDDSYHKVDRANGILEQLRTIVYNMRNDD